MKKCMLYLDNEQLQNSIDLLETARQMFALEPYETYGVIFGDGLNPQLSLFDHVIEVDPNVCEVCDTKTLTDVLFQVHNTYRFDAILVPATWVGRMVAPRLAVRLHTGLTADVTEIASHDGKIELIRPAFSGRLLARILPMGSGPIMLTVRQNVFTFESKVIKDTKHILFAYKDKAKEADTLNGIRCITSEPKKLTYDIRESDILISGGGGVEKHFSKLEHLAKALNGQVAASRRIVDAGIAERHIQVGQSGKTVSPKLYIALGIYGAIQHVEGLKNVEHLIAVNKNRNAPICSLADLVVEGDAIEFLENLVLKINTYQSDKK